MSNKSMSNKLLSFNIFQKLCYNQVVDNTFAIFSHIQYFKLVLTKKDFDTLPDHHKYNHIIKLVLKAKPKTSKIYSLFFVKQTELNLFIAKNLYTGCIRSLQSPMAVPVFLLRKKNSLLKLVQDYRVLNMMTIKNKYLFFLISGLVTKLKEAHYITKLDICWGFNCYKLKALE